MIALCNGTSCEKKAMLSSLNLTLVKWRYCQRRKLRETTKSTVAPHQGESLMILQT